MHLLIRFTEFPIIEHLPPSYAKTIDDPLRRACVLPDAGRGDAGADLPLSSRRHFDLCEQGLPELLQPGRAPPGRAELLRLHPRTRSPRGEEPIPVADRREPRRHLRASGEPSRRVRRLAGVDGPRRFRRQRPHPGVPVGRQGRHRAAGGRAQARPQRRSLPTVFRDQHRRHLHHPDGRQPCRLQPGVHPAFRFSLPAGGPGHQRSRALLGRPGPGAVSGSAQGKAAPRQLRIPLPAPGRPGDRRDRKRHRRLRRRGGSRRNLRVHGRPDRKRKKRCCGCCRPRKWMRSARWRAASRTTSTTC